MKNLYSLKRFYSKLLFYIASRMPFVQPTFRAKLYKMGGVCIECPKRTFIGYGVHIDDMDPGKVSIGEYSFLTQGVSILTHYVSSEYSKHIQFYYGRVSIGKHVFLGTNAVIVKPIVIGDFSIIGANSVVVCNIPPYEIWGGNPARFIRKRIQEDENTFPVS